MTDDLAKPFAYERKNGVPLLPRRGFGHVRLTTELVNFLLDRDEIDRYEDLMSFLEQEKRAREDPDPLYWVYEAGR